MLIQFSKLNYTIRSNFPKSKSNFPTISFNNTLTCDTISFCGTKEVRKDMVEINQKDVDLLLLGVKLPQYTTTEITEVEDDIDESYNRTEIRYRDKDGKTVRHDGYFNDGDILVKIARNGEDYFFFNGQIQRNVPEESEYQPCDFLCIKEWFSPGSKPGRLVRDSRNITSYDNDYNELKSN